MKKFLSVLTLGLAFFAALAQTSVFTMNTLPMPDTGFYNGSDGKGFFMDTAGNVVAKFYNQYDADWDSWQGWAYSTWIDDTSSSYNNQWSAYPGYRLDSTFALAYVGIDWSDNYKNIPVGIKFSAPIWPSSVYVANSTYAALTIRNGNNFARAFKDDDFFKLIIVGLRDGQPTDTIVHYLADFRNGMSFIQKDWSYIDLSCLGVIDSLSFNLISSDTGNYGMNTPGYFVLDMLRFSSASRTAAVSSQVIDNNINVYPNPASVFIKIPSSIELTKLYTLNGQKIGQWTEHTIPVSDLPSGLYVLRMWRSGKTFTKKIIIQH